MTGSNADQTWSGPVANANAGVWLDQGAVSNDSRRDLIVGAPGNASVLGKVYVIFGGPVRFGDVSLATADTTIAGGAAGDLFGYATAAGNILNIENTVPRNLVVGAPGAMGNRGAVYLFAGGFTEGNSLNTSNAVFTIIGATGDRLGSALATADLNNDGRREIIIGAPGTGRIYVINGSAALTGTLDLSNPATPANLTIGGTGLGNVLAAGDVTGDCISDLLVGSSTQNVVYLYKGKASGGLPTTPDAGFVGERAGDIIIGAPGSKGPAGDRVDGGAVYVLWGAPTLVSRNLADADVKFYGKAGDRAGAAVTSGDINRDTPDDLVILSPGAAGGAGELNVYYGRTRGSYGTLIDFGSSPALMDRTIVGSDSSNPIGSVQVFEVTGEGARDLIVGVPTVASNAGLIYFTISPRMIPGSRTINMIVNENGAVSASDTVVNASNVPITWTLSSNRSWLTTGSSTGSSVRGSDGSFNILGSSAGLAPGVYTGTVTITSTSNHLLMSVPITVNLTITSTRIFIDSPTSGSTVVQPYTLKGWAIESTSPASSGVTGVDAVHVYAYPNPGSGTAPVFLGAATYGYARDDVAAAYGAHFRNSGFQLPILGLAPGLYRLVVYAHHTASGVFTHYNFVDVNVMNNPAMGVYTPTNNSTVSSAFEITGWAIDRAAAVGPGVDTVHIYVFPNVGSGQAPVFIGVASMGWSHPDVGAMFGSQFTNSGFHFTITGLGPGVHDLAMYAHSTVSGRFDKVTVNRITVNNNLLMGIGLPGAESRVSTNFWAAGWAIDRSAASGTGVDTIHIYAYKNPGSGTPPVFLGVADYGQPHSGVAQLYGTRYLNSAFALQVTTLTPGVYDIVMFAHSTATNTFNNWAVVRTTVQ
ncbi:MAG: VCBS repeat-containing protein [Acidobacteriota bacterium]